jgi:hypothetical protein
MKKERMAEALAFHAQGLIGRQDNVEAVTLTDEEHSRLAPLFELAGCLKQSMPPVKPSAPFVRSLGEELVEHARHRVALAKRLRRGLLIGAAAFGSLLSVASVVGAIALVITRYRARAQARAMHAPTG